MMNKLNFGCGRDIRDGWVNVDIEKLKGADKLFDFNKTPYPFKDNTFDFILADNILEHLEDPKKVTKELWRISKDKAVIEVKVPYQNSKWAYADLEHKKFFNEHSIKDLFIQKNYISNKEDRFKILEIYLKPSTPFSYIPKIFLRILSRYLLNIYCQIRVMAKVIK